MKKNLLKNIENPVFNEISEWIIKVTKNAKDKHYYNDPIHSSFLQFIFMKNFKNFDNFNNLRLTIEYKFNLGEGERQVTRKKHGGKYGIITKVTKKNSKKSKFFY